jgi:hypothetical protein
MDVRFSPRSDVAAEALSSWSLADGDEDLLVLDLPYADDPAITAARARGRWVAVLDHVGQAQAHLALRIDPRKVFMAADRCIYGLAYAMVRPEILVEMPSKGDYALVCVGGSDLGDQGVAAAIHLVEIGIRTILIRGPLAGAIDIAPSGVEVRTNPPDLPQLIAGCAFAVTNAGTTALEAMAMGKPVHILAQTQAECATAGRFLSDRIILGFGLESLAAPDWERAEGIGAAARSAVDGKGARRVADLLINLLDGKLS